MDNQGRISVIIPTYQHAEALPACIDSILAQTYKNLEIIIVDDGSTDATQAVLAGYEDKITVIYQDNQGSNPARNRGWKEAQGEFLLFCDADVIARPDMLEKFHAALIANPDASIAYSSFIFGKKRFRGVVFDHTRLHEHNFIHTTSLVRAKDFPGFDNDIKRLQDWDVWLTMAKKGYKGVLVPEYLFTVRVAGKSRIGSHWMPKFLYHLPWKRIGYIPKQIQKYEEAKKILFMKHGISYEA